MFELVFQNDAAFIYKVKDWEVLRREYRILGEILGSTQYIPALPVCLLPEETLLLLNKGIATLVTYQNKTSNHTEIHNKVFKNLLEAETKVYKDIRRKQIASYIDKIIEGKQKKGDFRSKTEILDEELERTCLVTEDNIVWPILTETIPEIKGNPIMLPNEKILKYTNPVKSAVYADLWDRGYYITSGDKFGGDFLIYKGDPIIFHAIYIVRCLKTEDEKLHCSEVVGLGRLGTSVKKRGIFATLTKENSVKYITINWLEA